MSNPWLKKNPFLSMWLSTANTIAGSMLGHATAHVKRQSRAAVAQATRENTRILSGAAKPASSRAKRKR